MKHELGLELGLILTTRVKKGYKFIFQKITPTCTYLVYYHLQWLDNIYYIGVYDV